MFKNGNVKDELFQARLVNMFIHSVYVWNDKVAIVYNFSDGAKNEFRTDEIAVRIDTPLLDLAGAYTNHLQSVYFITPVHFVCIFALPLQ